jgi:predicted nuclease of predicted toxin-antitoxin system
VNFLVDMSLPPSWVGALQDAGWTAIHWSKVGRGAADDAEIMEYAARHGQIVLTHDLDFGTLLALTGASGPSVVQLRSPGVLPRQIGTITVAAIRQFEPELSRGALLTVDVQSARVRILPIR